MDYEALKEQWSEVEEQDGVRLSWNVFPSSRMVSISIFIVFLRASKWLSGSIEARRSHRSSVHSFEGEARYTSPPIRASNL